MSILRGITLADVICFFRGHDNLEKTTTGYYAEIPAKYVETECKRCGHKDSFCHLQLDFKAKVKEQK
jgi:hypothetical protein